MTSRRFNRVSLRNAEIYCTSTAHYWVENVRFIGRVAMSCAVMVPAMIYSDGSPLPQYMAAMLDDAICEADELKVFELNQDRVKRYKDYRYHCYGMMPEILRNAVDWHACEWCECGYVK